MLSKRKLSQFIHPIARKRMVRVEYFSQRVNTKFIDVERACSSPGVDKTFEKLVYLATSHQIEMFFRDGVRRRMDCLLRSHQQ